MSPNGKNYYPFSHLYNPSTKNCTGALNCWNNFEFLGETQRKWIFLAYQTMVNRSSSGTLISYWWSTCSVKIKCVYMYHILINFSVYPNRPVLSIITSISLYSSILLYMSLKIISNRRYILCHAIKTDYNYVCLWFRLNSKIKKAGKNSELVFRQGVWTFVLASV